VFSVLFCCSVVADPSNCINLVLTCPTPFCTLSKLSLVFSAASRYDLILATRPTSNNRENGGGGQGMDKGGQGMDRRGQGIDKGGQGMEDQEEEEDERDVR
jgi:hypothetical protein